MGQGKSTAPAPSSRHSSGHAPPAHRAHCRPTRPAITPVYWPTPVRGDVLLCHFPLVECPNRPGPKPRPALVVDTHEDGSLTLAYGTSQWARFSRDRSYAHRVVAITDPAHLSACGLGLPCLFDCSRLVTVPYNTDWFLEAKPGHSMGAPPKQADPIPVFDPLLGSMLGAPTLVAQTLSALYCAGHPELLPEPVRVHLEALSVSEKQGLGRCANLTPRSIP